MGEKSGGLTNMVLGIIAFVAIALIVQTAFPDLTETISSGLSSNVSDTLDSYTPEVGL